MTNLNDLTADLTTFLSDKLGTFEQKLAEAERERDEHCARAERYKVSFDQAASLHSEAQADAARLRGALATLERDTERHRERAEASASKLVRVYEALGIIAPTVEEPLEPMSDYPASAPADTIAEPIAEAPAPTVEPIAAAETTDHAADAKYAAWIMNELSDSPAGISVQWAAENYPDYRGGLEHAITRVSRIARQLVTANDAITFDGTYINLHDEAQTAPIADEPDADPNDARTFDVLARFTVEGLAGGVADQQSWEIGTDDPNFIVEYARRWQSGRERDAFEHIDRYELDDARLPAIVPAILKAQLAGKLSIDLQYERDDVGAILLGLTTQHQSVLELWRSAVPLGYGFKNQTVRNAMLGRPNLPPLPVGYQGGGLADSLAVVIDQRDTPLGWAVRTSPDGGDEIEETEAALVSLERKGLVRREGEKWYAVERQSDAPATAAPVAKVKAMPRGTKVARWKDGTRTYTQSNGGWASRYDKGSKVCFHASAENAHKHYRGHGSPEVVELRSATETSNKESRRLDQE